MSRACLADLGVGAPENAHRLAGRGISRGHATNVQHNVTFVEEFADDICGPRANTTTFTYQTLVLHLTAKADGTFTFQEVITANYTSDFHDPAIPTASGRFTEVNHFASTPGGTSITAITSHDFLGGIRIFFRVHITEVDDNLVVSRELFDFSGCP